MEIYNWSASTLTSYSYKCGYCGEQISSEKGFNASNPSKIKVNGRIYICHKCHRPTFIDVNFNQYPGPKIGTSVKHITDKNVEDLFNESRSCFSVGAYTSTVMCCRKLLMNIAVSEGAKEGKYYAEYIDYLDSKNFIPPKGKKWVDAIRELGNEANHEIKSKTKDEAERIINFTETLLRFNYELPFIMKGEDKI
jgi:hypothetical protein